jgi:hypothetical protein
VVNKRAIFSWQISLVSNWERQSCATLPAMQSAHTKRANASLHCAVLLLQVCDESQRERLLSRVRCYHEILKTSTFGKHIVNRLEKLLSAGMRIQINSLPPVLPTPAPAAVPAAVPQQQAAGPPPAPEQPGREALHATDSTTCPADAASAHSCHTSAQQA